MNREIFQKLAKRQAEGVMFHSEMADYYNFLNLQDLKEKHCCQYHNEGMTYRKIKDYFTDTYHKTLRIPDIRPINNIIPAEWDSKTSADVDKETLKVLLKSSLTTYLKWEEETHQIFKECADALFDKQCYNDYRFVRTLVDDVYTEKSHVEDMIIDLQGVDFDICMLKGFQYKM